ncbi:MULTISPECIES: bifunctional cytochrome P450/NADPH--P450 reductase [unclassified Streptomyces]|uniref:bifunctional cytochrome P450/NADPH--P450 reductase n=1 Tax=unclassified Streptomyces TaxID=2593676 RepID=UPI002E374D72|nr:MULTISPECIES: cytochrome P450 [unclassified Streptomyces]WUC67995.1 cytochrome P450 [Streptomyces sp. NBC_00539]
MSEPHTTGTGPLDDAAPHAPHLPVVDVSESGMTSTPLQSAMGHARRLGPVFVQRFHDRETVFVSAAALVEELSDEQRFVKGIGPALENVREVAADGLFTAYNDEPNWAKAHDILLPAFALTSMRTYHPHMLRVARRLIGSWDARFAGDAAVSAPVDVAEDMTRMTLDTIGLSGFGYDFASFEREQAHPFVQALVRALAHSQARLGRVPGADHTAEDEAFAADAAYLARVVDEVIEQRKASGDTSTDDLLGLMLGSPHPRSGEVLDGANIRNQVITFLIAGHETTSGALSFALYYLLKNPAVLHLAQAETDALWGDDPDPEPSFEDVGRLRYVRQVLGEALRLWPTAAAFAREARADTVIGGRYPVKAGQRMLVLTPMLHRDPLWGDNVEEFDPDRFAPEAEAARSPHAYKPFGTGERACIGRQFALHEATMLLGMLVHRYRLVDHARYELRIKETLTLKPEGFTMALGRRTPADRARNRAALGAVMAAGRREDTQTPAAGASPTRAVPGTRLTLLHGSNFGTCRSYAQDLAAMAGELGFETRVAPLDDHRDGGLPTDGPLVVVAASYNGQPTDDAAGFVSWLAQAAPGAAEGVRYAVLGVGDRNWAATYQQVPTLIDGRLASAGAARLMDRGEADASGDLAGAVRGFTAALRRTLLECYGDPASVAPSRSQESHVPVYEVAEITGEPLDALARRHDLRPMTVTHTGDLADLGHPAGRSKRFLRLRLPEGVGYRTADHLAVLPANDPAQVERAARILGADLDTVLDIRTRRPGRTTLPVDRPLAVRELLTRYVELQTPVTAEQAAVLAAHNPCPPEKAALERLAAGTAGDGACPGSLVDLIEEHPALQGRLPWPVLLELLEPMRPRHYSISSSPSAGPGRADLMISLLEAPHRSGRGGVFRGVGSSYLHRVRPGDTVLARVQPCREAFRIPHDERTPVIMIGAGTGLAPFRGAIADRRALRASGAELAPALCYFGCDHPDVDYLHRAELEDADREGAVSMRPAFSLAPEGRVRFVQHRIEAEGEEVWRLTEAGARIHVCGDGSRMAPGVREAFRRLYVRFSGKDESTAAEWLRGLIADGRYVEDVYVGG